MLFCMLVNNLLSRCGRTNKSWGLLEYNIIWYDKVALLTALFKNQNMKNLPQCYKYSSNNALSLFKQAKCFKVCPLENFKILNKIKFLSASLPTSQPANGNWPSAYTTGYIAFKLSENKHYFHLHKPLLFRLQYLLCAIACPILTDWSSCLKQRCWHSIKVLTFDKC